MEKLKKVHGKAYRGEAHRRTATLLGSGCPVAARRRPGDGEAGFAAAVLGVERHGVRAESTAQAKRRGGTEDDEVRRTGEILPLPPLFIGCGKTAVADPVCHDLHALRWKPPQRGPQDQSWAVTAG